LLGEALGIEHPDVYKKYKLMGDPDTAFAELQEYIHANGLGPVRVREILQETFAPPGDIEKWNPS
jgi:hypothetical protein